CGPPGTSAGRTLLALRPTAVRLQIDADRAVAPPTGATAGAPTAGAPTAGAAPVAATVVDSAYRGQGYDHVLALPDGTTLVGVFSEHRWTRASTVHITLDPDGRLCFTD